MAQEILNIAKNIYNKSKKEGQKWVDNIKLGMIK